MKLGKLIVDSSPIISLANIGCADLLLDLSSELIIPKGVFEEVTDYHQDDLAVIWIQNKLSYVRETGVPPIISEWDLGKGESQVLAFALTNKNFYTVIDDKPARNCAKVFNIKTYGTLSIIIKAKQFNFIKNVKPLLSKLQENGFRVSDTLIETILTLADEF